MLIPLSQAPIGTPLTVAHIPDGNFSTRIARLGLHEGSVLTRLDETASISSAKVRGSKGDVVLSGWLAGRIVMHLDDGRRLPLLECPPGSSGHVEGVTSHRIMENVLQDLGIVEDASIVFVRRIPPMIYKARVDGKYSAQLNEGLASKLLGESSDGTVRQFCSVGVGDSFRVKKILGGENAVNTLAAMYIRPGTTLVLLSVAASQTVNLSDKNPVICLTHEGLRLYFKSKDAAGISVLVESEPSETLPE